MRTKMLGEAASSLLKPLKRAGESATEVLLGSREIRKYFLMILSYCCSILEAKDMFAVRHGVGRQHPCVRCHGTYEDRVMGTWSAGRVVAETMETKRRVKKIIRGG